MQNINYLLYNVNDTVWIIIQVISAIVSVISFIDFIKNHRKILLRMITIGCAIVLFCLSFYCRNLTSVPAVIGMYYGDACTLLVNKGLRYETEEIQENSIVAEQSIAAGTVVKKDTIISMVLQNANTDTEQKINTEEEQEIIIKELKEAGVPFRDLWLIYYDETMEILENGNTILCFGDEIMNLDIENIVLKNTDYGLQFTNYEIEECNVYGKEEIVVKFKDIPSGYYELESKIAGYQIKKTEKMYLSTDWMQGDIAEGEEYWGRRIYMYRNDASRLFPYSIYVVDANGKKVNGRTCTLMYKNTNTQIGNYEIEDGMIQLNFMAQKGSSIIIGILNSKNLEIEFYYEVTFDDVNNCPVIKLE